jgi:hypothetical protein
MRWTAKDQGNKLLRLINQNRVDPTNFNRTYIKGLIQLDPSFIGIGEDNFYRNAKKLFQKVALERELSGGRGVLFIFSSIQKDY